MNRQTVLTTLALAGDATKGLNSHHWHADGGSEGWADEPLPGRLKAFLYLDPTTRDGGALRVRSPRFPFPLLRLGRLSPEGHEGLS